MIDLIDNLIETAVVSRDISFLYRLDLPVYESYLNIIIYHDVDSTITDEQFVIDGYIYHTVSEVNILEWCDRDITPSSEGYHLYTIHGIHGRHIFNKLVWLSYGGRHFISVSPKIESYVNNSVRYSNPSAILL